MALSLFASCPISATRRRSASALPVQFRHQFAPSIAIALFVLLSLSPLISSISSAPLSSSSLPIHLSYACPNGLLIDVLTLVAFAVLPSRSARRALGPKERSVSTFSFGNGGGKWERCEETTEDSGSEDCLQFVYSQDGTPSPKQITSITNLRPKWTINFLN